MHLQLSIEQMVGFAVIGLLLVLITINGLVMLISPLRWFEFPSYLAFRGSMRREQYLGTRAGRLQIRLLGFTFVAIVTWMVVECVDIRMPISRDQVAFSGVGATTNLIIVVLISLSVLWVGAQILIRPKRWRERYMVSTLSEPEAGQHALDHTLQAIGVAVMASALYFIWQCVSSLLVNH